jgi:Mg2+/Co2+ transporter CorB
MAQISGSAFQSTFFLAFFSSAGVFVSVAVVVAIVYLFAEYLFDASGSKESTAERNVPVGYTRCKR